MIERINKDLKMAMREKDKVKRETLRLLKSSIQYYKMRKKIEKLEDEDVISVIQKEVKKRLDAIEDAKDAGRQDLVDREQEEAEILKLYLPKMLTEVELDGIIKETISELKAATMKDMGKVMKAVLSKTKGRAEAASVSKKVRALLS